MIDFWAAVMRGHQLHIEYAKRLPRKKKKFIKSIFKIAGDLAGDFAIVSMEFDRQVSIQTRGDR